MSDLASLIARLEAAEGPSRELDAEIWRALGNGVFYSNETQPQPCDKDTGNYLPLLTASLDSALSLVPEGCAVDFKRFQNTGDGWACVWTARGNRSGNGKTVAIALCLAALKARAQG